MKINNLYDLIEFRGQAIKIFEDFCAKEGLLPSNSVIKGQDYDSFTDLIGKYLIDRNGAVNAGFESLKGLSSALVEEFDDIISRYGAGKLPAYKKFFLEGKIRDLYREWNLIGERNYFRLYLTILFDGPLPEGTYITPGGYKMVFNGKKVCFDFSETASGVSAENPYIYEIMGRYPDFAAFPDLEYLTPEDLKKLEHIEEIYLDMEGMEESCLNPVKIQSLSICCEEYILSDADAVKAFVF